MRWLPWRRREELPAGGYEALLRQLAYLRVHGRSGADPARSSVVAAASSLYASALAGARVVDAPAHVERALGPFELGHLGRRYPVAGESTLRISIEGGRMRLIPVTVNEHRAGGLFEVHYAESDTQERDELLSAGELLHVVYEPAADPARGSAPWLRAEGAARALAALEASTADEASGPTGSLMSRPGDTSGELEGSVEDAVVKRINAAAGDVVAVPAHRFRLRGAGSGRGDPAAGARGDPHEDRADLLDLARAHHA